MKTEVTRNEIKQCSDHGCPCLPWYMESGLVVHKLRQHVTAARMEQHRKLDMRPGSLHLTHSRLTPCFYVARS